MLGQALVVPLLLCCIACRGAALPDPEPAGPRQAAPAATERPLQIVAVEPGEGENVPGDATVRVALDFGRGAHAVAPDSLRLFVDAEDVTDRSRITFTEDVPPSRGEVSYTATPPLSPGRHGAEVRFADTANEHFSYAWSFSVRQR